MLICAIAILLVSTPVQKARTYAQADNDPITLLPASDIVMSADVKRILSEALPLILAGAPDRLTRLNQSIDNIKTKTGFDIRSIERVHLATRFNTQQLTSPKFDDLVAIVQGSFDANVMLAAAKLAMNGKYKEEKHGGKSVFLFDIEDQIGRHIEKTKISLNAAAPSELLAVTVINATTLALGSQQKVNQVIDSNGGQGTKLSPELLNMAKRNPTALLSIGAVIPPDLTKGFNVGNDEVARVLSSIKQVFFSTRMASNGLDLNVAAGTTSSEMATSLNATLGALKQFGSTMIQNEDFRRMLNNINLSAEGTEVLLKTVVSMDDVNKFAKSLR